MASYFFHVRAGEIIIADPDGSHLPDLVAAHRAALEYARHMWAAAIIEQRDLSGHRFEIADEAGVTLLTVPFKEALPAGLQ